MKEMGVEAKRLAKLQERMLKGLRAKPTDIVVNGDQEAHPRQPRRSSLQAMSKASR